MTFSFEQLRVFLPMIVLTVISGIGDSQGFLHAARVWRDGRVVWPEVAMSAAGFALGVSLYWVAIRFYQQMGATSAESQTILWFTVTITGVALLSGQFLRWQRLDQLVAVGVVVGVAWLLARTGG